MTGDSDRFAEFIVTLGRGPGRSRALTRDEAREAFAMMLASRADPVQVGAFLMLLRYRGEDAEEVTGLVEAARTDAGLDDSTLGAALDWPSYGAGRTRTLPWFLLAALALARAGIPVLMHGSNAFSSGVPVQDALAGLGMRPASGLADAAERLQTERFAYLPIEVLAPRLASLLEMRRLFGLRSPVNTVVRLLNPGNAPCGVDGVFHPPYIQLHLGVAERLRRSRLLVVKGGGGEAERNPFKPVVVHLWQGDVGTAEITLPARLAGGQKSLRKDGAELLAQVWAGYAASDTDTATVCGTIALALLALGRAACPATADEMAHAVWKARHDRSNVHVAGSPTDINRATEEPITPKAKVRRPSPLGSAKVPSERMIGSSRTP